MSDEPDWFAMHYLSPWEERAGSPLLPKWFRTMSLAFGRQRANGHSPFGVGDVALILGAIDPETGQYLPDANVSRHISLCVQYGLLDESSSARCLVVRARSTAGGLGGKRAAGAPCSWHDRHKRHGAKSLT